MHMQTELNDTEKEKETYEDDMDWLAERPSLIWIVPTLFMVMMMAIMLGTKWFLDKLQVYNANKYCFSSFCLIWRSRKTR